MDAYAAIKVISEAKTPWPRDHYLMLRTGVRQFKAGHEDKFRRILGIYDMHYTHNFNVLIVTLHYRSNRSIHAGSQC